MSSDLSSIIRFINSYTSFAVIGHEDPDGDSLGSQLALASLLGRLGKKTCPVSPGPFHRPEIAHLQPRFFDSVKGCGERPEAVFVVDCSTSDRIGRISDEIVGLPVAVIDHHTAGEPFGETRFIDSTAPSVTLLIHRLMKELNLPVNREEADWLLFGLCTDTGFFRHLGEKTGNVFAAVEEFVEVGASPGDIYYRIVGNRTLASRKLTGRLIDRTVSLFNGRVLLTWESARDRAELGTEKADSDTLYRELQRVAKCMAVVLVREEDEGNCSVGLRSVGSFDVGTLARKMGGGGHRNASGYRAEGTIEAVKHNITQEMAHLLSSSP